MTEQVINRVDVLGALASIEDKLFGQVFESQIVPLRLQNVFVEMYIRNWYPTESILLIQSYKLLQQKGYYYDR